MSNINCKYGCKNGRIYMPKLGQFVDCPDHAKKNVDIEKVKVNDELSLADALLIPEHYRGLGVVDRALFTRSVVEVYSQNSINTMGALLEKINKNLYKGVVPKISCYIHSPAIVDMKHFVYASQKLALENGLSVVPYISANRLYQVQSMVDFSLGALDEADKLLSIKNSKTVEGLGSDVLDLINYTNGMTKEEILERAEKKLRVLSTDAINAVEGYRHLNETGLTYRDYIRADVCYIYAGANTKASGFSAIADILAERSMRNLPTFVFGYWASTEGKTSYTLNYLLSKEGNVRLDLLVPFDLVNKSNKGKVEFKKNLDKIDSTKSDVVGGYRI